MCQAQENILNILIMIHGEDAKSLLPLHPFVSYLIFLFFLIFRFLSSLHQLLFFPLPRLPEYHRA